MRFLLYIISVLSVVAFTLSCKNDNAAEVPFKVKTALFDQDKNEDVEYTKVPLTSLILN